MFLLPSSFLPLKIETMLNVHRECSQFFNPNRLKWSYRSHIMFWWWMVLLLLFCIHWCFRPPPRGLGAGLECVRSPFFSGSVISRENVKLYYSGTSLFPDVSNCGSIPPSSSLYHYLSILPLPQTISSPGAFVYTMLICLSWERKSFLLTN